jgi:thiazole synthase ThiGH ThiG subunit
MIESNNLGSTFINLLQTSGVFINTFVTTAHSKRRIIDQFTVAIERNKITLPKNETIIKELQQFQCTYKPDGGVTFGAANGHDDIIMSLMIAYDGYRRYIFNGDYSKLKLIRLN